VNRVILIGRLVDAPTLRYVGNGKAVADFRLAVDRPYKNRDGERQTDFINIVAWGKQAENCANYLDKGRQVAVDGRLEISRWQDQQGNNRYTPQVVAQSVQFLGNKKEGDEGAHSTSSDDDYSDVPF